MLWYQVLVASARAQGIRAPVPGTLNLHLTENREQYLTPTYKAKLKDNMAGRPGKKKGTVPDTNLY